MKDGMAKTAFARMKVYLTNKKAVHWKYKSGSKSNYMVSITVRIWNSDNKRRNARKVVSSCSVVMEKFEDTLDSKKSQ